jgi:hypothetical protein
MESAHKLCGAANQNPLSHYITTQQHVNTMVTLTHILTPQTRTR